LAVAAATYVTARLSYLYFEVRFLKLKQYFEPHVQVAPTTDGDDEESVTLPAATSKSFGRVETG
jgi:hypothetical protein